MGGHFFWQIGNITCGIQITFEAYINVYLKIRFCGYALAAILKFGFRFASGENWQKKATIPMKPPMYIS